MSFTDLSPQPPLYPPEAEDYARSALALSAAAVLRCERVADIQYGDTAAHRLDVYPSQNDHGRASPVLVFAHGGAWTNGYKEWVALMAPALVAAGITFVSVSYRLAPGFKWQALLDDCLSAISWVHRNIHEYGGDPSRIALGGHSAGGHLMTLAALSADGLTRHGIPASSIVACFPLCAPLDIRYPDRLADSGEERTHQILLHDASEAALASPVCLLNEDAPLMLLAYAKEDLPRIIKGNQTMQAELRRLQRPCETMVLPGDHFSPALAAGDAEYPWTNRLIQILRG
ncbi:alpha/beta hydrolase [Achromobacter spanius]|uniref:alpha/beta hydrolase n=1 Tax=Achromobacter spanius TaxID=217203 RepID=UPI002226060D|nr:alpha/beta hydrolase [Achromobacter spanius]MCW3153621.1 alpha/beta hydrolase [Achromobacter spanius]